MSWTAAGAAGGRKCQPSGLVCTYVWWGWGVPVSCLAILFWLKEERGLALCVIGSQRGELSCECGGPVGDEGLQMAVTLVSLSPL